MWLPWGTQANEKLVPYSMRGFHVTMSIRNGVDVRKLAKSLGTSPRMIDQTYDDFQTDAEIDELTKRSGIANIGEVKWDKNDYPILELTQWQDTEAHTNQKIPNRMNCLAQR